MPRSLRYCERIKSDGSILNLSDLLLQNQGRKDWKGQSFTTTDEEFLKKLRISSSFFKIDFEKEWIRSYTYARKVMLETF
jgi:hypothetical protein